MSKYKKYYDLMLSQNEELFKKFRVVHDAYSQNPEKNQLEFNETGREVQDIVRDYEDRLCAQSEKSSYGKFSTSLSEKFWDEVRKNFPKVDHIGLLK